MCVRYVGYTAVAVGSSRSQQQQQYSQVAQQDRHTAEREAERPYWLFFSSGSFPSTAALAVNLWLVFVYLVYLVCSYVRIILYVLYIQQTAVVRQYVSKQITKLPVLGGPVRSSRPVRQSSNSSNIYYLYYYRYILLQRIIRIIVI